MRIFFGTFIDRSLFEFLFEEIKEDFSQASSGKWVELDNLHFTYKFIGDVEDEKIDDIRYAASGILGKYDSPLIVKGLGAFPNAKKARVLFAQVSNPEDKLIEINNNIENEMEKLGFEKEKRIFKSHITLQRPKKINNTGKFIELLKKYKDFTFGAMNDFEVSLIQSELTPKGPIYRKIV